MATITIATRPLFTSAFRPCSTATASAAPVNTTRSQQFLTALLRALGAFAA